MLPGAESALIVVPQEAANSFVGFKLDATTVDDSKSNILRNNVFLSNQIEDSEYLD